MTKPPTYEVKSGKQLQRIIRKEYLENGDRAYDALDPNPFSNLDWTFELFPKSLNGITVEGRFSPFRSCSEVIPAIYLAETARAAYFESVIRPYGADITTLQSNSIERIEVSTVQFSNMLKFADLRSTFLKDGSKPFWRYTFDELFNSTQLKSIKACRSLAKDIHGEYPNFDGLVWDSVRLPNVLVFVLFGHKRDGIIVSSESSMENTQDWKPDLIEQVKFGNVIVSDELASKL
ncbi:RES family NAD+ phosphorylase [Shewanella sp. YLB-07]|uniref:RES family NAD+ phosphorylase n=1 Tax=Shewanella sp. YLB-07 TaxID=2601268 RepID=UPI00128C2CCB|nr:RES family NAD+ phosphorylase [Shewanella sp. YLB-07]MPY24534.1 hypothetical protein [Shewanella sp. YLB-07]